MGKQYRTADYYRKEFPHAKILILENSRGERVYIKKGDTLPSGLWVVITYWE